MHPAGVQVRVCVITPHAPQLAEHAAVLHADQLDDWQMFVVVLMVVVGFGVLLVTAEND